MFHPHSQTQSFVFGRISPDIVAVEVRRQSGEIVGPVPVIAGPRGPFYVVELPTDDIPVEVIGYRADGTFIRYPLRD
jgi:hypothetical protein